MLLFTLAGLVLVGFVLYDLVHTTLGRGSGPLAAWIGRVTWRVIVQGDHVGSRIWQRVLPQVGMGIMLEVIAAWVLLLWTGWTLVFLGAGDGLIDASTQLPAGFADVVYFAGYTMTTLGQGDFRPVGAPWQLATVLGSMSGLFVLTFSITYIVPVLQAAVHRRHVATWISGLGLSARSILQNTWDADGDCSALQSHLQALTPELALLSQRHRTYPVLHYFHGEGRREAFAPNLAALDEALTMIEHGFEYACVSRGAALPLRTAIAEVLGSLDDPALHGNPEVPRAPGLAGLRQHGYPVACSDAVFAERLADPELAERRTLLLGLVQYESWNWDDIQPPPDEDALEPGEVDEDEHAS